MKKGLGKILARMAKDGDVETVAEFIEEMIGESAEEVAAGTQGEGTGSGFAEENAAAPVVVEAPEAKEVVIDEDTVAGIIERLDKLIALLSAAPAGDEEPEALAEAEEIAEIIGKSSKRLPRLQKGTGRRTRTKTPWRRLRKS